MMKSLLSKTVFAAAGIMLSSATLAEDFSYTNISIAYVAAAEFGDEDYDGYRVTGRLALNDALFLQASQTSLESEDPLSIGGGPLTTQDVDSTSIGLGFHHSLLEALDIVLSVSFLDAETFIDQVIVDSDGFDIGVGARYAVGNRIEVNGTLRHLSLDENDSTLFQADARYFLTKVISFGVGYDLEVENPSDNDQLSVDVRIDF